MIIIDPDKIGPAIAKRAKESPAISPPKLPQIPAAAEDDVMVEQLAMLVAHKKFEHGFCQCDDCQLLYTVSLLAKPLLLKRFAVTVSKQVVKRSR